MNYNFEWDPHKAQQNLQKHKINFESATEIFSDPFSISIFDDEHSATEDRWVSIGKDHSNNVLVVIHTFREISTNESNIRIISARKTIKNEIKQYEAI
ncbi:MAG: BrnT family toxin [Deferribacteres bacterium]|nr:BrnT family toxin [candidate division KSB1 bacterium]MCB9503505.1 BrnT family toxin [Deferribacteres bacterium]